MGKARTIIDGVYLIGGPDVSRGDDATSFIVDFGGELVMIDAGAGGSSRILQKNIEDAGLDPKTISTLILTHNHIDHIGSAPYFRTQFGCKIVMHDLTRAPLRKATVSGLLPVVTGPFFRRLRSTARSLEITKSSVLAGANSTACIRLGIRLGLCPYILTGQGSAYYSARTSMGRFWTSLDPI